MKHYSLSEAMDYVKIHVPKPTEPEKPKLTFSRPLGRDRIDGGDPVRVPVDRVAARVVSRASWWAMPPSEPTKPKPQKTMPKVIKVHPGTPHIGGLEKDKSDTEFNSEFATAVVRQVKQDAENAERLVERIKEAAAAIEYFTTHIPTAYMEASKQIASAIDGLRQRKFALESETRQIMAALGDVRQFFFNDKHEIQVKRLAEFVNLCERLKALKDSGFLDDVADTILKLEK